MAKRKRLSAANPIFLEAGNGLSPASVTRAPIAEVAAETSASAALREVTQELERARESGRMILEIPLASVEQDYLVRDRMVADNEEMEALVSSISERGQQTPIDVVRLSEGRFGLISGWRRCQALARLQQEGKGNGLVLAFERSPENAPDAYRAMIEENEIRVGLSYFERARIVDRAVEQAVFETHRQALQSLFSAASRAKRSKIGSFVKVVQVLGDGLTYPAALGERIGLRLARLIDQYPDALRDLARECARAGHETAEEEQAFLNQWVARFEAGKTPGHDKKAVERSRKEPPVETRPRPDVLVRFHADAGRIELAGKGLTKELHGALLEWLSQHR